jgi:ATP-dependent DNA helicase RecG
MRMRRMQLLENHHTEFKERLTPDLDLEKTIIAFLNAPEGGIVYIGIADNGRIVGVNDLDGDMLKIKDRIKNNISPSVMGLFDIIDDLQDRKHVIKIVVASGSEKPYFKKKYGMTEKGCYMRAGSSVESMPQTTIDKLFSTRTRYSIGKIKSNRQNLSFEQLRIYYDEKGTPLNHNFKNNLELLTPEGDLNYAAYLLADTNNISIKVAKYQGTTRVDLIESNEYGYVSLIKAIKNVLNKINIENKTFTKMTGKEREEKRPWNELALREAIINAFVHNDYTTELAPKFEIFSDRIEITSNGSLPFGLEKEEFFEGFSVPRNKELMRIFKDLGLVEQLGSGIPRILKCYSRNCFLFTENFLRMSFPSSTPLDVATPEATPEAAPEVTPEVAAVVNLLKERGGELSRDELLHGFGLKDKEHFRKTYLVPALAKGLIELTIPDKPKSPKQKYRVSERGRRIKDAK